METLSITTTLKHPRRVTGHTTHRILRTIKDHILGASYTLSVVYVGERRSQTLNRTYRGKDHPTNILSFPLAHNEGELFITLPLAEKEARRYRRTPKEHIRALFIHGCLHLKGLRHGATMDREEKRWQKKFLSL
ncbi:rRNA maturation RNase YbeY [Candidatus Wolfebacteria bacterium]|nr:rRNA maturation RNase YbeY [Candidatus Wolfebacteria bacterium]